MFEYVQNCMYWFGYQEVLCACYFIGKEGGGDSLTIINLMLEAPVIESMCCLVSCQ